MMLPVDAYATFRSMLAADGLNLVRPIRARDAAAFTRTGHGVATGSILVCGSGGTGHWERIRSTGRTPHPIEDHGRAAIDRGLACLPGARQLELEETIAYDLRRLGEAAGFGHLSPFLQILIHPTFGPWISIRGLVHTPIVIIEPASEPFDPCTGCDRPCLDACPVGAFAPGRPFDLERCADHRLRERAPALPCADACRSRRACVVGTEHAYGDAEYRHRHRSNLADLRRWFESR